jgi:hypothetical protein
MVIVRALAALLLGFGISAAVAAPDETQDPRADQTYSSGEIIQKGADFFGVTTEAMAKALEQVLSRFGSPDAYIAGSEGSGAFIVGLRYGEGELFMKQSPAPEKIYWQGPSAGFDFGANASKVFTLVYNLQQPDKLFTRFPGIEGSAYVVAGIGVNYEQSGSIILAPVRSGVGVRAGVDAGYLSYSRERSWIPF